MRWCGNKTKTQRIAIITRMYLKQSFTYFKVSLHRRIRLACKEDLSCIKKIEEQQQNETRFWYPAIINAFDDIYECGQQNEVESLSQERAPSSKCTSNYLKSDSEPNLSSLSPWVWKINSNVNR